jgi:alpha-L-glutamate ligase-like protein
MKRWWHRWLRTPGELRGLGVVGINMRNAGYLLPNNPRRLYALVDNKLTTKRLAAQRGIATAANFGLVETSRDVARLHQLIGARDSFVMKPCRGSGGKGVLVIAGRAGDRFFKPSGKEISMEELRRHASNILAGLYSLGGRRDQGLLECLITPTKVLMDISFQGSPDIRIVMLHGYPVMAMLRAATRQSDGRANLHQGAIGVGIDLGSGMTVRAIHHGRSINQHPDLGVPLVGLQVPFWDELLAIAAECYEMTGLGYLGVDLMIDDLTGPVMIEINARPGLAIQMANGVGLLKRLRPVAEHVRNHPGETKAARIAFVQKRFGGASAAEGGSPRSPARMS